MTAVAEKPVVSLSASRERNLITRFRRLSIEGGRLDFDRAALARDIRNEFPPGEVGDESFREWIRTRLGVRGKASVRLSNLAQALTLFPSQADWTLFGAASLVFLTSLTVSNRNRLLADLRKRAVKANATVLSTATVRQRARALGMLGRRTEGGGGRTGYRARFNTLAAYVRKLQESGQITLPKNVATLVVTTN